MGSSISVCFLTRNHEEHIARAIRSVAGVADQVLVADTGSVDRTAQAASELGADVGRFRWEDDFSAGRNDLVARATCDWILWLNPDEEFLPARVGELRDATSRGDAFGFFLIVQHPVRADRPDLFSETADLRLLRRRPDLRFVGRLHPHIDPASADSAERDGLRAFPSRIALRSHADPSGRNEATLRWTARLLDLELRDRPDQLHYQIEQGVTLLLLGDPKGHALLNEAIDRVLAVRDAPAAPSWKVQVLLDYVLAEAAEAARGRLSRDEAEQLVLRWFPNSPALLWRMAGLYHRSGDFRRAAGLLERLLRLGETSSYDRSAKFDPKIIGDQARMNLGACYGQLGETDAAERCFRKLLQNPEFGEEAAQNLAALRGPRPPLRGSTS